MNEEIVVQGMNPYLTLQAVRSLLENGFEAKEALINYDFYSKSPISSDTAPLTLNGELCGKLTTLKIMGVAAGSFSAKASATARILKAAGFEADYYEIVTPAMMDDHGLIQLKYEK